ncbi:putative patatin-like protein 3 [Iris pallida]|uniref:Patatin-like protein 3 n=1 Tax=Iris pallida TaxID=29817 RepID=A0AAX6GWE4_IRIPA|nr:putative patatin-like protein 3 [Iris pallida]
MEPNFEMDKLSYEIFSILENKFLFSGYSPSKSPSPSADHGKVRILSIDGLGDGLLAGAVLARLESSLRLRSGDPDARLSDFFDVAAGSGLGGVLAAMLFTRGSDGKPLFSAEESLRFLSKNRSHFKNRSALRRIFRSPNGIFRKLFPEPLTLRDTLKPLLIPCYDLSTGAPFLFSRADAVETDGYDFGIARVCSATCADKHAVEMRSVDGRTRIVAVGGGAAAPNPTAAAITHVLNNKLEFPFANGVEDLLVVSIGSGEPERIGRDVGSGTPSRKAMVRTASHGAADMVDQAVAMSFEHTGSNNYIRIQGDGSGGVGGDCRKMVESVLRNRHVESVLFRGKKVSEQTNGEKLEWFCREVMKEQVRRKSSRIPTVVLKQTMSTPRTSSATTSTIITTTSTGTSTSPSSTLS